MKIIAPQTAPMAMDPDSLADTFFVCGQIAVPTC
jgi:hypothetical protein